MITTIFIDDGGVMSDNTIKAVQWQRLLPEYFVPRYGGEAESWGKANFTIISYIVKKIPELVQQNPFLTHEAYQKWEDKTLIEYMFDNVNVPRPPEKEYYNICRDLEKFVTPQISSAIPCMTEILKTLKEKGYTLHTCSGETSWVLRNYLREMKIEEAFTTLYGPDIVNIMKGGLVFYQKVFEHAKVKPEEAIVIDDSFNLLKMVEKLGATPIQSCVLKKPSPRIKTYYENPKELLGLLAIN